MPFVSEEHIDIKKKLIQTQGKKKVKNCVKYNSCIWNIQLLTQSDLFKAKHHLLHIQLMVAMANKSSHCTVLLQYAWQLQVYHLEISIMILADLSSIRQLILYSIRCSIFILIKIKCKHSRIIWKWISL